MVVVLTHADVGFEGYSLKTYITSLPEKEGHISMSTEIGFPYANMTTIKPISLKKFLKNEVSEHVMAVNNYCKREYERVKQQDALIELIDVMLLKNATL